MSTTTENNILHVSKQHKPEILYGATGKRREGSGMKVKLQVHYPCVGMHMYIELFSTWWWLRAVDSNVKNRV